MLRSRFCTPMWLRCHHSQSHPSCSSSLLRRVVRHICPSPHHPKTTSHFERIERCLLLLRSLRRVLLLSKARRPLSPSSSTLPSTGSPILFSFLTLSFKDSVSEHSTPSPSPASTSPYLLPACAPHLQPQHPVPPRDLPCRRFPHGQEVWPASPTDRRPQPRNIHLEHSQTSRTYVHHLSHHQD